MDEWLREFITKKWKAGKFSFTFLDILLAVCITGTGAMLRLAVVEYTVTDFTKLAAMAMDFVLAVFAAAIVYSYTGQRLRAFLTYAVLAVYPTMAANSALWGRNSVFSAFLFFLGLYLLIKGAKVLAGAGFAAGALVSLAGLRLSTQNLTLGWPNIYEIIGKKAFVDLFNQVSILVILGFLLTAVYCFVKKGVKLTKDLALAAFLFLAIFLPYFAPSMPAWAGYTADIAALVYCMRWPKKFYVPMLHLIVSYSAYANVINGETKLPMVLYAVILLLLLADAGISVYREACKSAEIS